MTTILVNLADLVDPSDSRGRTYRQINAAKTHTVAVGALVEMDDGTRSWVVHQGRDCDMTPLYWLSLDRDDVAVKREGFRNPSWYGGVPEGKIIEVLRDMP